jgi:DNA-binding response OmpR family regulator
MPDSILLIDDDVLLLRSIGRFFEQHGWDVYRELSGEAGLATFERSLPDVVMLDLNLPGMDGLEVLEHLRGRETVVILLTGDNDVASAVKAIRAGAENFLVKPVELEHLLVVAERGAEKGRLRRVNRTLIGQSAANADDARGGAADHRRGAKRPDVCLDPRRGRDREAAHRPTASRRLTPRPGAVHRDGDRVGRH